MVWTRAELKSYAKDFLRKHYWKAFIVCLIFTLLTGGNDSNSNSEVRYSETPPVENQYWMEEEDNTLVDRGTNGFMRFLSLYANFPVWLAGASINAFLILVMILISLLIGPLITVGKNRFFLKGFKGDASIRYLFSTFNRNEFWGIFKCMFITQIKNALWFLLLIIPGIIKSYEYRMVPYLLTKEPDLTSREAIEISRDLTAGHKWEMFVLDLSFLGWYLLGALLFGIGIFFVVPYEEATQARLYNVLSGNDEDMDDYDIVYE